MTYWDNLILQNLSEIYNGVLYIEEWIDIPELPNYKISSFGRVKSMPRKRVLKVKNALGAEFYIKEKIIKQNYNINDKKDYPRISLKINGKSICKLVHILVAKAFLINENELPEVNHKL